MVSVLAQTTDTRSQWLPQPGLHVHLARIRRLRGPWRRTRRGVEAGRIVACVEATSSWFFSTQPKAVRALNPNSMRCNPPLSAHQLLQSVRTSGFLDTLKMYLKVSRRKEFSGACEASARGWLAAPASRCQRPFWSVSHRRQGTEA